MKPTRKQKNMADFFNALAHPRRQMIFQILREAQDEGLPFHQLLKRTGLTRSTLAFHLGKMSHGRILRRKIKGPETWLSLDTSSFYQFSTPISGVGQR